MNLQKIAFCERRIADEEMLADNAAFVEDTAAHAQLAMIYRAQLQVLKMQQAKRWQTRSPVPAAVPCGEII